MTGSADPVLNGVADRLAQSPEIAVPAEPYAEASRLLDSSAGDRAAFDALLAQP